MLLEKTDLSIAIEASQRLKSYFLNASELRRIEDVTESLSLSRNARLRFPLVF